MSDTEDNTSNPGSDSIDYQPCYIYSPISANEDITTPPTKKRKLVTQSSSATISKITIQFEFQPLLNGLESTECRRLRHKVFEQAWAVTNARIQEILDSANKSTIDDISNFVLKTRAKINNHEIPTAFITTGPNISSQGLLFRQISSRLKLDMSGPVVLLHSSNSSNLKSVLKQLIREAILQRADSYHEDIPLDIENVSTSLLSKMTLILKGRKLLNYNLKILHKYVKSSGSVSITVAFQDSEAFDSNLITEMIILLSSWRDRIPFVLIFGIATSVDLFEERISRAASRCLSGVEFEVEQTNSLLHRIFLRVVAGAKVPLRLGTGLILMLIERQKNHVQSIQQFVAALKYVYMCHFYFDALSIFNITGKMIPLLSYVQPEHYEAIRMLPSFRDLIQSLCVSESSKEDLLAAQSLLTDNKILHDRLEKTLASKDIVGIRISRALHILMVVLPGNTSVIDLYLLALKGRLGDSEYVISFLDSIKRMAPTTLVNLIISISNLIHHGAPEMDLDGWADEESDFLLKISRIKSQISALEKSCSEHEKELKSSYAIQHKGIRTTVVAQRVQLSYEESSLSNEDKEFTALVDELFRLLAHFFSLPNLSSNFLNEVWTFDSLQQHREVFSPRPRAAIERALTFPSDYLSNYGSNFVSGANIIRPATSVLYHLYLEGGSLINISDLWNTFSSLMSDSDQTTVHEKDILVYFYRALAEIKMLGMIKQSKRKVDHLAKVLWNGL